MESIEPKAPATVLRSFDRCRAARAIRWVPARCCWTNQIASFTAPMLPRQSAIWWHVDVSGWSTMMSRISIVGFRSKQRSSCETREDDKTAHSRSHLSGSARHRFRDVGGLVPALQRQRLPARLTGPPRFIGVPGRTPTPGAPTPGVTTARATGRATSTAPGLTMQPVGYEMYWQYTTAFACPVLAATNPVTSSANGAM